MSDPSKQKQATKSRCALVSGSRRRGFVLYKERWVTRAWYRRYVLSATRVPGRRDPILVRLYLPAIRAVNEPAEMWLINLGSHADRQRMETIMECYAMPGGKELTTFFHVNVVHEPTRPATPEN